MKARHKRFIFVILGMAAFASATGFVLRALDNSVSLYRSPTDVVKGIDMPKQGRSFHLGGLVEPGSVRRQQDGVTVEFEVTDHKNKVKVRYKGILPDLFKEGKSVVTQGMLEDGGLFVASEVLAKHDEEYMPKEVAQMLAEKEKGQQPSN